MEPFVIDDPVFAAGVQALDEGREEDLRRLLDENPGLATRRLDRPAEGYFANPFLLWFVADNPIRHESMPPNITAIANLIIGQVRQVDPASLQSQLDYTLELVCSGSVPRRCGLQIPLIDTLIDAGARPDSGIAPALPHGELEALNRLIERGAVMTLAVAIALDRPGDAASLLDQSDKAARQAGLATAAFYGRAGYLTQLLVTDVDINAFNPPGYHDHSTPLHQAALAGWLDCVKLLVEAGAALSIRDTIHHGTPLRWASYAGQQAVIDYLRSFG